MSIKCRFCEKSARSYFLYAPKVYALCKNCRKLYGAKAKHRITKEDYLAILAMEVL